MKLKTFDNRLKLTNGTYHSLVNARKPKGIEDKKAYLIGTGIGALAAGCFLIRDAHMAGEKITFLEQLDIPGGSLDGAVRQNAGYVARGGREMGHYFEVLWNLFSSLPSTEDPSMTVLDYFYYTNYDDPNSSNCRITKNRGERYDNGKFNLGQELAMELATFVMMSDESLENKTIEDIFSEELLNSDFWTYWRTMFAFENWHSALEMKLYMNRFIHHVGGLPDLSALQFSRHDQYTSFVKPMVKYLEDHGAKFEYGITVDNVEFSITEEKKVAKKIVARDKAGNDVSINLTENDLVFITNGSMTEGSGYGDDNTPAPFNKEAGGCWTLWRNIAEQSDEFGRPDKFCTDPEKSNWESCTVTCHDERVPEYIEKITKRSPYGGRTVTGGIVTALDSSWLMSWTINRQEQYYGQPEKDVVVWVYGLFSDTPGDYIKKPMRDCTGKEITKEWLYHIGVPVEEIEELAKSCTAVPVMMPFITSQFMPRESGDRPYVVPKNAVNFAFLGQFAETLDDPGRDTVFTIEYSGRTAMEAVYVLTGVEKGVPEVYASRYDIRYLLNAGKCLLDGEKPEINISPMMKQMILQKAAGTEIEILLKEYGII
ncbi:oleate hydratase [Alkaliphilus oremlandii]|uniref:67 kDa myosin-cross-reactive antigen family protein n=1 Tax=Alkaliphilus oremlandii (strain OhILAs) TaxID=350688 RepID=A8MEI3_ALKOO|nr:oleate hydratase [Alkaliphilus oremlandii]ABW18312.1 67 kDa myosin-cross-reactive antigen family protein [Alkaliphilus oremlandii OhILAs]